MSWLDIVLFFISLVAIICGLLLSGQGAGNGIAALSGQETELFRKTKDRGFFKQVQITMLVLTIIFIVVGAMIVTHQNKGYIVLAAIIITIVLLTWYFLGKTTDRSINTIKLIIGLILGIGIGLFVYLAAIATNRKSNININDK